MTATSQHDWLRRVSDYHGGAVDAAEAAAVEEHLAGCEECRQALAIYRRFYLLASSPLQLGEPSGNVVEHLSLDHSISSRFTDGDMWEHHLHDRMRPERNHLLMGIASVLAASLIIVGFLAVLGPRIHGVDGYPTPTSLASATPAGPTPTVQVTNLPDSGTGYTNAGPDWASMLAFAPSSPNIVYACGEFPYRSGPLLIAVSTNGGHTWQSRTSPGILSACNLTVDPTNPRDLALVTQYCSLSYDPDLAGCEPHTHLYRTDDGGQTWTEVSTPGGDWVAPAVAGYGIPEIAWVGSALFIGTTEGIARSIAGRPFTLLRQTFFGTTSVALNARGLFTSGRTLIVTDTQCLGAESPYTCSGQTERSNDLGAHWSPMSMTYQSYLVSLVAVGADGKTLIGLLRSSTYLGYLRSTDGGANWSPLPPPPASEEGFAGVYESSDEMFSELPVTVAPDGTIFTTFDLPGPSSSGTIPSILGIYVLAPGAENWRYFAPLPTGGLSIFLWNGAGHLSAIWGQRGYPSLSGFQYRLF